VPAQNEDSRTVAEIFARMLEKDNDDKASRYVFIGDLDSNNKR